MKATTRYISNSYFHFGIISIVCFFTFFVNNQLIPADLMESRNLTAAQEMVQYGNYLLPTRNGELSFEKPPLPTWIAAGMEIVSPGNLGVQRYASGLAATLLIVFLYLFVSHLTGNRYVGLLASLIAATTFNMIMGGRTASWDIYTHSLMLGAIYFLFIALREKAQWRYFLFAGLFAGLSFLSKGPVSLNAVFLPFLISYLIVYRKGFEGKKWKIVGMTLVFVLVGCWWHGFINVSQHGDFALKVMQKESASWFIRNVRQWYYYWQFPVEAGIWTFFWIVAIGYFFVNKNTAYRKEYKFSLIWFLATLILLSIFPEKKTRWLMPLLIPCAMMIGFYLIQMITDMKTKGERIVFRTCTMIIVVALTVVPFILYVVFFIEKQVSLFFFLFASACCWGICVYLTLALYGKKGIRPVNVVIGFVLTMMMTTGVYMKPVVSIFVNEDRHSIRLLRNNKEIEGLPFFYNESEELRLELIFELNRRIIKLDLSDDEAIAKAAPFVFISGESIEKVMADKNVSIDFIDTFDNNWRQKINFDFINNKWTKKISFLEKKANKHYNPNLVREVAVIRAKE